jgi:D-cysteine desulfhydrase
VITFGAVQTNHGRQTAAACARLGLRCELLLTEMVPRSGEAYHRSGNVLLDHVYGARVHVCADFAAAGAAYERLVAEAAAEGRTVATIPLGGSNGIGALGYVAAAAEIREQLDERGLGEVRVVAPCSSGATVAGLAVGASVSNWRGRLDVACVSHPADEARATVGQLAAETASLLGVPAPSLDGVWFDDVSLGEGYGIPDDSVWRAIELFGSTAGIALDPVYSGKAAAALLAWVDQGRIGADEVVVFLHTGGLPGLFGYAPEAFSRVAGQA